MKYGWLMFVAGAVLTWGAYVVTIDHGRTDLAGIKMAGRPLVPPAVAAMLDAAMASGNAATLKAVADMARQTNPAARADIDARLAAHAAAAARVLQERLATQAWHEGIGGQGEIGLTRSTGNTDSTGVALRVNLTKKTRNWKHGVRATVDYQR